MVDYPRVLYSDEGKIRVVSNEAQHKAMGAGWSDKYDPARHMMGLRRASGAISDEPLQLTPKPGEVTK